MPTGIFIRTEKHKKNISLANKGKVRTQEMNEKNSIARKGKSLSEKHIENIRKSLLGNKYSLGKTWNWKKGKKSKEEKAKVKYLYYLKNKEKSLERVRIWRKENPDKIRIHNFNRLSKEKGLTLEIFQKVYEDNIKKYGTLTCYLCENPVPFKKDNLEHKIPLSRGGSNLYENLAVSCQKCNCRKGTKTEEEYRRVVI